MLKTVHIIPYLPKDIYSPLLQNLLHVLDTFSNAKEKMVSASIETAKLAQETTTSTLILLSLEVESPVVKIPRSSDCTEGYKVQNV